VTPPTSCGAFPREFTAQSAMSSTLSSCLPTCREVCCARAAPGRTVGVGRVNSPEASARTAPRGCRHRGRLVLCKTQLEARPSGAHHAGGRHDGAANRGGRRLLPRPLARGEQQPHRHRVPTAAGTSRPAQRTPPHPVCGPSPPPRSPIPTDSPPLAPVLHVFSWAASSLLPSHLYAAWINVHTVSAPAPPPRAH